MNAALLGSVGALSWGVHDFLARFPSRRLGPTNTTFIATAAGLVGLSLWVVLDGVPLRMVWPALWLVAVAGIFAALATLSLFAALALGPISIVAPIAASFPAPALVFAVAAGARPTVIQWLAMSAVLVGVALVSRASGRHEALGAIEPGMLRTVLGLSLLASLGFAVAVTGGQAAAAEAGSIETAWIARIFALATIALFYLRPAVRWEKPGRWLPLLGVMGGLDALALTAIIAAGNLPDPAIATVVSSAFSAVSVLLARLILKEMIVPIQLVGMVLVFGGVAVLAGS